MGTSGATGASAVAAGDLDRDGDLDLVSASAGDDTIRWFASDGAALPTFTAATITSSALGASDVAAHDVDADGDVDVIVASADDDTIAWYDNDGAATPSFTQRVLTTSADGASAVAAADLDSDGDLDVLAASATDGTIAWFDSNGAATPSFTERSISVTSAGASDVYAADVDLDGDLDVVASAATAGTVVWFENDGAAPPSFTAHSVASAAIGATSARAADLDRDGKPDILFAAGGLDAIAWARNQGGQYRVETTITAPSMLIDATETQVLRFDVSHRGIATDNDAELVSVSLLFEKSAGMPMSDAEFNAFIDTVTIYADDGSGSLEIGTDAVVSALGGTKVLTSGVHQLPLTDGDANAATAPGASQRYFATFLLTASASSQPVNTIRVTHLTETTPRTAAEDRDHDIPILMERAADTASGILTASNGLVACSDGIDNDGDTLTDFPADPGCRDAGWDFEAPQCNDGLDNDGDGLIDVLDPQCKGVAWRNRENSACGLGFELIFALPPVLALRRARRRRS